MPRFRELFIWGLILVWGSVLLLRSGIFGLRIIRETLQPPQPYWPELSKCHSLQDLTLEQKYVVIYRSLGETCLE